MTKDQFGRDEKRIAEIDGKRKRIAVLLQEKKIDAALISRHENLAWVTAGMVDVRVGVLRESGPASLLITREGGAYYLTTNNEALRLAEEEFAGLGFEPIVNPWHANDVQASIAKVVGHGIVASDGSQDGRPTLPLASLRCELTDGEVERYRWLGQHSARAAVAVVRRVQSGMSELTMQALLAEQLIEDGILPSVYLTAADARILNYPHPVPRNGLVRDLGMVCFCARRWGLSVSMTRFVQFGATSDEFDKRFAVVTQVNAQLLDATREGATSDALFAVARNAYASLGYAGGELGHHQGGATGYLEREWFARPGGTERVGSQQAFAWNPNLRGAKVEDTVLLCDGKLELLTATPELPVIITSSNGAEYSSADVLRN